MEKKIVLDEHIKVLAVSFAIVLMTFVASYNIIFKPHFNKVKQLRLDTVEEKNRLVLRKDISKIDDLIKEYRNCLYLYGKADQYALRDKISSLAQKAGVNIVSMQPREPEKIGSYVRLSFLVKARCNYDSLGRFVESIERLQQLTKIDELILNTERRYGTVEEWSGPMPEEKPEVDMSLSISAYCIGQQ